MIIEIPDDNSIIKWKKNDKEDWKSAEISDLIKSYEERPIGDCISRSALKKALQNREECKECTDIDCIHCFYDIIDNALVVEPEITIEQAVAKIHETGLLSEHDKMMKEWVDIKCAYCNKYVRPQGEWVYDPDHSITIDMYKCSVCGCFGHTHFKFCQNCGAAMQKGEEE